MRWREWHHGYLGAGLIVLALLPQWLVWTVGLTLMVEDFLWQHAFGLPSPLKWLYLKLLWPLFIMRRGERFYFVQVLNRWLDEQFGKKTPVV